MRSIRLQEITVEELTEKIVNELKKQLQNDPNVGNRDKSPTDEILTRKQLMEFLGCTPSTLWKYMKKGLPIYQIGKKQFARKDEVMDFMRINNGKQKSKKFS